MKVQEIRIENLIPYENNPRDNDKAVDKVANSIKEFGFKQPIVIDKNNVIVIGHTRLKASKKLGLKTVPCLYADDLTDDQIKALRLADNKTNEFASWNLDKLDLEIKDIELDLEPFGFDIDLRFDDEIVEDEIPEVPDKPKSKLGEIYKLGEHRLMCGDSTKLEDVEKLMNGEKADMVFTDPPWNVNYGDVDDDNAQGYKPRKILNDFMGTDEFKKFMFNSFKCMNFCSKKGCMTYIVMSAQEWGNMMLTLAQNDYHWSSTIIWNKDSLVLSRKDYHTKYEPIWYGWKKGKRLCPLKDRKQSDVWDFNRPKKSDEHPTMKPIDLISKAILNSSKKHSNVLER